MKLARKLCSDCGKRRGIIERLFALDDEQCDDCHFEYIREIRERCSRSENTKKAH